MNNVNEGVQKFYAYFATKGSAFRRIFCASQETADAEVKALLLFE